MHPLWLHDRATEEMKERIRRAESFRMAHPTRQASWRRRLGLSFARILR